MILPFGSFWFVFGSLFGVFSVVVVLGACRAAALADRAAGRP